jgi:hypothetical protein
LRFSIDMDLPCQRIERGQIIVSLPDLDSRQAITAADGSGCAHAQRAVSIIDADL